VADHQFAGRTARRAGVAAETKFQVLLLCAVLAVAVLALGPRELLGRPMLWLGTGIAALMALPTLIWQAVHGWPQLQMGAIVASEADALYGGRTGVALALVLVPGIVGVPLTLYGLWRLLRAPELRPRSDVREDIARRAAAAYHALPPDQQARTVVMGQSYILAAYLDGYSTAYCLPQAFSSNRSYGYFPPPPDGADAVLYVGSGPDEVAPYFADVRKVADGGADASVWLCTGRREPWASFCPQLRHLTVS